MLLLSSSVNALIVFLPRIQTFFCFVNTVKPGGLWLLQETTTFICGM